MHAESVGKALQPSSSPPASHPSHIPFSLSQQHDRAGLRTNLRLNYIRAKCHLAKDLMSAWQGHSKKSARQNVSIRQAFSWQHNLILRQSAVYTTPEQMTIYFIVLACLECNSFLNPSLLLTSIALYSNWLYSTTYWANVPLFFLHVLPGERTLGAGWGGMFL